MNGKCWIPEDDWDSGTPSLHRVSYKAQAKLKRGITRLESADK